MKSSAPVVLVIYKKGSGKYSCLLYINLHVNLEVYRYANMDYIFFSAIMGVVLLHIMISYDIVCQWKVHLAARSLLLPEHLRQTSSDLPDLKDRLSFGIPIWHAGAHEDKCQVSNSLRYQPGAGHTDGEGVERGWSRVNPHASSTKEMGAGARQDALDDIFAHNNFERNIGLGTLSAYPSVAV